MWSSVVVDSKEGIKILIEVVPGSSISGITGYDEWRKRIKLNVRAKARDGEANSEVVSLLSDLFGASAIITAGRKSRQKTVLISEIDKGMIIKKLEEHLGPL